MKVGRYNYAAQFPDAALDQVMADLRTMVIAGRYILTPEVTAFEQAFADMHQARFGRGVNSGTDALAIAFAALGLAPGDEVITQANTFNATVNAIVTAGATPVLVDCDPSTYLIDVSQIESAVTPRTRAIVPVHLFGNPTPMDPILTIARRHDLFVVEDAAQAHGATREGARVGSAGHAGCFSFHPSKNLAAAGDAGAIVTNDAALAAAIDEIRSLGQRGQNQHVRTGCNSKLDSLQARVLLAKLPYLDGWNADRRRIAAAYRAGLHDLPITFQAECTETEEANVYHLFQVRTPQRDALLAHLVAHGVDAVVRYPQPIHLQPAFAQQLWRAGAFPVAEALANELLCLPIRPDLTAAETAYVCDTVRAFFTAR